MRDKNCFNCGQFPMCKIRHFLLENPIIDTLAENYNKDFNKLYQTIGEVCSSYEDKREKE